jgi:ferrous iron transport protein B
MSIALVPGLAAREVAVGALATVYAVEGGENARGALGAVLAHQWILPQALAFLAWYVFAPQCAATLGVIRRETGSWVWPAVTFAYMVSLAWTTSFVVYHLALAAGLR